MSLVHARLKHQVMQAIEELFSDKSVPMETTLESLEELEGEIGVRICALEEDIAHRARED